MIKFKGKRRGSTNIVTKTYILKNQYTYERLINTQEYIRFVINFINDNNLIQTKYYDKIVLNQIICFSDYYYPSIFIERTYYKDKWNDSELHKNLEKEFLFIDPKYKTIDYE